MHEQADERRGEEHDSRDPIDVPEAGDDPDEG
jgi:hypothetical protein